MQLGMVGLGRMGANLVRRLRKDDHDCVVFDLNPTAVKQIVVDGILGANSIADLVSQLAKPRAVWLMLPAAETGKAVKELASCLEAGDIIIDGGNSYYRDDIRRAEALKSKGIHYVDCGTSGGVFGKERGYCLMIGGDYQAVRHLAPIFRSLAPGFDVVPRTPGRVGAPEDAEIGYLHCGPCGSGHFVKMVHNGIEYGLMAAYAEGMNILRHANAGNRVPDADAETTPLRNPEYYQYDLDLPQIAEVWRRGSVISSWLLDLAATSLRDDPDLKVYAGHVSDSGEGRWAIEAAIDEAVPVPVLSAALYERFTSRGGSDFSDRILSAMRKQFGGHDEMQEESVTT